MGANDNPEGKPEDGQPAQPGDEKPAGLPPVLSQVPPPPDKAAIDRQAAKVESARQALDASQAKLDDAAGQTYAQGAGAGPSRDDTNALSQAVFDARAELTEQRRILNELNYASAAAGGPTAPVAPLPENSDVQAFPPEPPVLERATGAFAEGMKDTSKTLWDVTMPDVGNMYDVATNWDEATPDQKRQAAIDAAGMVPLPGAKLLGEGIEHGLDALGAAGRHADDVPTPHVDVDAPSGSPDVGGDLVDLAPYGIEDTSALLSASEAAGGHLIERHVGKTFDDLAARLDSTGLKVVSTFATTDEAASAVNAALQHNQQRLTDWIANGAPDRLELDAPFSGGATLQRGAPELVPVPALKWCWKVTEPAVGTC